MSYSTEVLIKGPASEVYTAISSQIEKWWGRTDYPVTKVGDEFTTSFDQTHWKFKITEFEPNKRIVWNCIDAKHIHEGYNGIEKEWLGTCVEWNLKETSDGKETQLHFIHNGLVSDLNCYEICYPAWEMFVTKSLKKFVETGEGMPYLA